VVAEAAVVVTEAAVVTPAKVVAATVVTPAKVVAATVVTAEVAVVTAEVAAVAMPRGYRGGHRGRICFRKGAEQHRAGDRGCAHCACCYATGRRQ
jgi:hypothetical protein